MHRRKFLAASTQAAGAYAFLPVAPRAQENQTSTALKSGESSAGLVANLEKLLPNLMEKSIVPGLSIALVQDGKLLWRKAFGVNRGSRDCLRGRVSQQNGFCLSRREFV